MTPSLPSIRRLHLRIGLKSHHLLLPVGFSKASMMASVKGSPTSGLLGIFIVAAGGKDLHAGRIIDQVVQHLAVYQM